MRPTSHVAVELKTRKFPLPEYAGRLNVYVALIHDVLPRYPHDETIVILMPGTKIDRSVRCSPGCSRSFNAAAAHTSDALPASVVKADAELDTAALNWVEPT